MNACFLLTRLHARRKRQAKSADVRFRKARSLFLIWAAPARARRIVICSFSVRVGAAALQKSGCLRYLRACGGVCWLRYMFLRRMMRWQDKDSDQAISRANAIAACAATPRREVAFR